KCNLLFSCRCILVIIIAHYTEPHQQKQHTHFTSSITFQNQLRHYFANHYARPKTSSCKAMVMPIVK
ncbi:MAG: hypothetical protein PHE75_06845, partial [Candidatus Cloacimonas acidaminovorans]|nr:hypothetical protein [Candidatus Cloacimonas acidaminovorans]